MESLTHELGVLQQRRFGELDGEVLGFDARSLERLLDVAHEIWIDDLLRGNVDADRDVGIAGGVPAGDLIAGLAQDESADRHDQPGFLGNRDELDRFDYASGTVVPTEERLERLDPAGLEIHQRLVSHRELVVLKSFSQVAV